MNRLEKFLHIGIGIIITCLAFVFLFKKIAPFGGRATFIYSLDNNPSEFKNFSNFLATDFLVQGNSGIAHIPVFSINKNWVNFSVHSPWGHLSRATVRMIFRKEPANIDDDTSGLLNVSVAVNDPRQTDIDFKDIDGLVVNPQGWFHVASGTLQLWQKTHDYTSIDDFLSKLSFNQKNIAAYRFSVPSKTLRIKDYQPSMKSNVFRASLRPPFTAYTYIENEPLNFYFYKKDLNFHEGMDIVSVRIYRDSHLIFERDIPDDGISSASNEGLQEQKIHIQIKDLPAGTYKIFLSPKNNISDSVISGIQTTQQYLVFKNMLSFYNPGHPVSIWANAQKLNFITFHTIGLQTVLIDNSIPVAITERNKEKNILLQKDGMYSIFIPEQDIMISGNDDSYFSLSKESFFLLNPAKIIPYSGSLNFDFIDYIIADVRNPIFLENRWKQNEVSFDMSDVQLNNKSVDFILRSDGLQEVNGKLLIKRIDIILEK